MTAKSNTHLHSYQVCNHLINLFSLLSLLDEAKRVINCGGRVFAAKEDPDVKRIWMAEGDCPGLAMSRAFGDFCLKEYGLSSVPDVSHRKITKQDEFVVLASDGVSIQILLYFL